MSGDFCPSGEEERRSAVVVNVRAAKALNEFSCYVERPGFMREEMHGVISRTLRSNVTHQQEHEIGDEWRRTEVADLQR